MAFIASNSRPLCCLRSYAALLRSTRPPVPSFRCLSTYGYEQAKALIYSKNGNPADVLSLHTHSLSPPHSNLVTLRTLAAPLNPADINTIQGTYPSSPPFTTNLGTTTPVAVPGNEAVFSVLSTGSSVTTVKKGDWVIPAHTSLGAWRTHLQVPETSLIRIERDGLTAVQAGSVSVNPVTAYRLLDSLRTRLSRIGSKRAWYIQNGANSAVGRMVIQLAKLWGIPGISIIRARDDKDAESALKEELRGLGATHVVTDAEAYSKSFTEEAASWRNGDEGQEPLLLGLNCVGGDAAFSMAKLLSANSLVATYGAMGRAPLKIPSSLLIFKGVSFTGFWVSSWAEQNPGEKRKTVEEILQLYREGKLVDGPVEEVRWGWDTKGEELVDAVQGTLEGYRKGKGVFVFGDDT